jgi:hypothetical protein
MAFIKFEGREWTWLGICIGAEGVATQEGCNRVWMHAAADLDGE